MTESLKVQEKYTSSMMRFCHLLDCQKNIEAKRLNSSRKLSIYYWWNMVLHNNKMAKMLHWHAVGIGQKIIHWSDL